MDQKLIKPCQGIGAKNRKHVKVNNYSLQWMGKDNKRLFIKKCNKFYLKRL